MTNKAKCWYMKNTAIALAALAVLGLGIYYVSVPTAPSQSEIVKIGVIAPLTGPLAEYGEAFKNGILLAEEQSATHNAEFIFEDSAYDPKRAIAAFNKLADVDRVQVVMDWGSPTSDAIAPVAAKRSDVAFLAFTSVTSVSVEGAQTIRMWERPETFAAETWKYLRAHNVKNVAAIKVENQYINSLFTELQRQAGPGETVDLIETVATFGEKDFRTSISKIKSSATKYDAVGVYLGSGQIGQFYKQMAEQDVKLVTFGTDFFESQSDIDAAGTAIDGAVYAHYDVPDTFKEEYLAKFGNLSQVAYAGNSFDMATFFLNSTALSDSTSIVAAVQEIKAHTGVMGTYSYKTNADGDKYLSVPVHIKEIRNGAITTIR